MILPCASRWTISIGWMTRQRTRTTSPALTLDGTRMRILPMSLIPSAPAAADGDLHLALRRQQCPVALLDDGADVGRLAEADVGADERRSEEHTSELQSPCNLVCRLLLEKKKK